MPTCAIVSFRLGLTDGVSIVADMWQRVLADLGFDVLTVAGEGPVDKIVPGLAIGAAEPAGAEEIRSALAGADLVVAENICTIPLNLGASRNLARVLAGRPAVLHHHDPAWQRPQWAHVTELPPQDPQWRHVVINDLTRHQMASRRISATTIHNAFDTDPPTGDRPGTRRALDVADDEWLFAHPVRAIRRKNIPAALEFCEATGATYWLLGPAEEGYGPELARLTAGARCRVIHRQIPDLADVYAACDAVLFPSTWEGFGNPPIEAAIWGRPAVVAPYPVARELAQFGFEWFDPDRPGELAAFLRSDDDELIAVNRKVAEDHFSPSVLADSLDRLLREAGWSP